MFNPVGASSDTWRSSVLRWVAGGRLRLLVLLLAACAGARAPDRRALREDDVSEVYRAKARGHHPHGSQEDLLKDLLARPDLAPEQRAEVLVRLAQIRVGQAQDLLMYEQDAAMAWQAYEVARRCLLSALEVAPEYPRAVATLAEVDAALAALPVTPYP